MDAEELKLLRASLRATLATSTDPDAALREVGAEELLSQGPAALALVFEELGHARKASSLLDAVVVAALGLSQHPQPQVVFAFPTRGVGAAASSGRVDDARATLTVNGLLVSQGKLAEQLLVVDETRPRPWAGLVPCARLSVVELTGLDPDGHIRRVIGSVPLSEVPTADLKRPWTAALAAARRAVAAELLGVTQQLCDIAAEHVTTRKQFGRALGSFQSVRHRLAQAHVEISAARAIADMLQQDRAGSLDDELAWSMALKASAGRAYETTARDAVQVCGAMGLTWEHPLPGYVRRGAVLNALLGDASELTSVLGAMILRGENLPTFDPFES